MNGRRLFGFIATEDYLTETNSMTQNMGIVRHSVVNLIEKVDFIIACSEGVASALKSLGHYQGRMMTVNNGCDAGSSLLTMRIV